MRYKSCDHIESDLNLFANGHAPACCFRSATGRLGNAQLDYGRYKDDKFNLVECKNILRAANQGDNPPCGGCPAFKDAEWPKSDVLGSVLVATSLQCNLACRYCSCYNNFEPVYAESSILPWIAGWMEKGLIAPAKTMFHLGGGEPLINPDFEALADFAITNTISVNLVSNSVIFSHKVLELADEGLLANLCTSVDAGTREMFTQIRGRDCLDAVWEHLTLYNQAVQKSGRDIVVAQYILMDYNCSCSEIDAFAERVKRSGINRVFLSYDLGKLHEGKTYLHDAREYFYSKLNSVAVVMTPYEDMFGDFDKQKTGQFDRKESYVKGQALEDHEKCLKIVHNLSDYRNSLNAILHELTMGRSFALYVKGSTNIHEYPDYFLAIAKICDQTELSGQPAIFSEKFAVPAENIAPHILRQIEQFRAKYRISFITGISSDSLYYIYFTPISAGT